MMRDYLRDLFLDSKVPCHQHRHQHLHQRIWFSLTNKILDRFRMGFIKGRPTEHVLHLDFDRVMSRTVSMQLAFIR